MTKRTIECLSGLHPRFKPLAEKFVAACEQLAAESGVKVEVISGLRSWAQQEELYAHGRTKPGPVVTNAPPGYSYHNFGLAIDFGVFEKGKYLDEIKPSVAHQWYVKFAKLAEKFGIEWAGNWKSFQEDCHFQCSFGKSLAQLRESIKQQHYKIEYLDL